MKRLMIAAALVRPLYWRSSRLGAEQRHHAQPGRQRCLSAKRRQYSSADGKCMLTIDLKVSVDYPLELTQKSELVAKTVDDVINKAKDDIMTSVSGDFIPGSGQYELDITYNTVAHSDEFTRCC